VVRFLILLAVLPIIAAFVARWWLGLRVISTAGRRQCSCDLALWEKSFGTENPPPSKSGDALIFAETLRKASLADWKTREPKAAASRAGVRRFGMAVPPLALMVVVLGAIVKRVPVSFVLPVFLTAIALAIIFSYLSIAPELNAMLIASRRLRASGAFHRRDDEDAVIAATKALVWKESTPPILNLIQK